MPQPSEKPSSSPAQSWYLRVPFASTKVRVPAKARDAAEDILIPEASAGFFSLLTFSWMSPILSVGYTRPLETSDLYKLQDSRSSSYISSLILESFERRRKTAETFNDGVAKGSVRPGWREVWWTILGQKAQSEAKWRQKTRKTPSLVLAMNDSVKYWFWSAGCMKLAADVLTILSPLLVQALVNFGTESYTARSNSNEPPPLWKGAVLALGLVLMQALSSIFTHQFWYRASSTGVLLRGGLISAIYRRSFTLSSHARVTLSNGQLVTHIAADVSRIDNACGLAHTAWTAMVQILISLIILWNNLGPSALIGFSTLILGIPLQTYIMKKSYKARTYSMEYTDRRVKFTSEMLGGIRIIKFFAWEEACIKTLTSIRKFELKFVRRLLLLRAANNAVAMSFPVIATVLAFIAYSLTGHSLDAGIIFSSLTVFQLLRTPVMLLPISLSSITDAYNATSRLFNVFIAETDSKDPNIDADMANAVEVRNASFTWEVPMEHSQISRHAKKRRWRNIIGDGKEEVPPSEDREFEKEHRVFAMEDLNLSVPRGQLCAIVGPVGSGKSSLLQGLIGEMHKTRGDVKFGGSISYCPQSAWIQTGTIRDNICFGKVFESERYRKAVRDSCLDADLKLLPNGDLTEVGEKGISLSGGQRQRINICRSVYANADIQIYDDPLSALDARVGREVFRQVMKSNGQDSTRIIVTHALRILPETDFIVALDNGRIVGQGTYHEMMENEGPFARIMRSFVQDQREVEDAETSEVVTKGTGMDSSENVDQADGIMQEEERAVGSVNADVYSFYFIAGKGKLLLPLIFASLVLVQASNVVSSFWLTYWQDQKWPRSQGFYIGVYAGLGGFQAILSFVFGSLFAMQAYLASRELHRSALLRVIRAPMSFFETTPMGRIINRFSKDLDFVDNYLGDAWSSATNSFAMIVGTIALISAIFPWFMIAAAVLFACYFYFSLYYRASAREINRLNNLLRSTLVSHFAESLSGLSTINAYGEARRFIEENVKLIDNENRAYWLTVANQRWLGIRLDAFGVILTILVTVVSIATRFTLNPSKTGIMLSFILSIQYSLSLVVRQGAYAENMMNSVERIVHYAKNVEQERVKGEPEDQPPSWPSRGAIQMRDVQLSYRPGLPLVLKGIDMDINAGEKIGIVGRTGAGKSSIMAALYRLVELGAGTISIDGVDISKLDLALLRKSISIIPQDAVLFLGSVRSNIDPFGEYDDTHLWDALQRSHLVSHSKQATHSKESVSEGPSLSLDTPIDNDGGNFSMGERSLISLARALVKDSRILVLDEATASVDFETDRKIQETIAKEFKEQTILCIALLKFVHPTPDRLQTIIGYDRVCVMDAGRIAEFDTPLNLYEQHGIFRSMCEHSGISAKDLLQARKGLE